MKPKSIPGKGGRRSLIKILAVQLAVAAAVFGVLLIFKNVKTPAAESAYETVIKAFRYNIPVSENDDDIGKIKFVDKIKESAVAADTLPVEMELPVADAAVDAEGGIFNITGYKSCMVTACERGVVKSLGFIAGIKYIEILHPGGITSRCQGITAAGVKVNEAVKKGQPVATAETGGSLVFFLLKDNAPMGTVVYRDGRIQW